MESNVLKLDKPSLNCISVHVIDRKRVCKSKILSDNSRITTNTLMEIQPKLGGVVKICFYFGYKIYILRDIALKFGRLIINTV